MNYYKNFEAVGFVPTTGMFVEVEYITGEAEGSTVDGKYLGVVVDDKVIYQDGEYDYVHVIFSDSKQGCSDAKVINIWGKDTCSFRLCSVTDPIWSAKTADLSCPQELKQTVVAAAASKLPEQNNQKKPSETCRERLQKEHPEYVRHAYFGGCYGCPYDYNYAAKPSYCCPDGVYEEETCQLCWNRPVEEV